MTFLPIVERELRVAARRHSTFWMRLVLALAAIAISFWLLSRRIGQAATGAGEGNISAVPRHTRFGLLPGFRPA